MTTYTVFNLDMDDPETDEHVSGLSLEEAARELIERAGCETTFEREGGVMTLTLSHKDVLRNLSAPPPAAPVVQAENADDAAAVREILGKIVHGAVPLPGPYIAKPDDEYRRGAGEPA